MGNLAHQRLIDAHMHTVRTTDDRGNEILVVETTFARFDGRRCRSIRERLAFSVEDIAFIMMCTADQIEQWEHADNVPDWVAEYYFNLAFHARKPVPAEEGELLFLRKENISIQAMRGDGKRH